MENDGKFHWNLNIYSNAQNNTILKAYAQNLTLLWAEENDSETYVDNIQAENPILLPTQNMKFHTR